MSASSTISELYLEEDICNRSRNIFINQKGVEDFAEEVIRVLKANPKEYFPEIGKKYYRHSYFPNYHDYRSADWLFVLNTLNFRLYTEKSTKQWTVNREKGYLALCYTIKRAIEKKNKPLWNPLYYAFMTANEMENIFLGDDGIPIPFQKERLEILHNIGKILIDKYNGTFLSCIKLCNNDAKLLMKLLTNEFPWYYDTSMYLYHKVCLNTKAKILINDLEIYYPMKSTSCVRMTTMFADSYCLQILADFKMFFYSDKFAIKLFDKDVPPSVRNGDPDELELRSCAIVAVKRVCEELQKMLESVSQDVIDFIRPFDISTIVDNILFRLVKFDDISRNLFYKIMTVHY